MNTSVNTVRSKDELPSQLLSTNLAKKLETYVTNFILFKLKLAQIIILDESALNSDESTDQEFNTIKNKIDDLIKKYRTAIKPNFRKQFIKIISFFNKFISYFPFLETDLNSLKADTSLNTYQVPLALLKTQVKDALHLNFLLVKELKQTSSELDLIYSKLARLQEELMPDANEINALKVGLDSVESDIDQYNKEIVKTNFFSNHAPHLILNSSSLSETSKTDSELPLNYSLMSTNDPKITIGFSVAKHQETMEALTRKFPSISLIFSFSQLIKSLTEIFLDLISDVSDIDASLEAIAKNIEKIIVFIDNNKEDKEAVDQALDCVKNTKNVFLDLSSFSVQLLAKTSIEIPSYAELPAKLKLLFLLKEPANNLVNIALDCN